MIHSICKSCWIVRDIEQKTYGGQCRSCASKHRPIKELPTTYIEQDCICGKRYAGLKTKKACSPRCLRILNKSKDPYFGDNLLESPGIKDRICQLCYHPISDKSAMHPHHIYRQDRDTNAIVALHASCHQMVTYLAQRAWGEKEFARLIQLAAMQATGKDCNVIVTLID